jgi:hypothetical protein
MRTNNVEHRTNIIDSHQQKKYNEIEHVIETSGLIDFNGININEHEQMTNAFQNLHHNQYLSYNHCTIMINKYNNPNLIACMFPTLFPFEIDVPKMNNRPIKLSLQIHVKHLMNLYEIHYQFSKKNLFLFFVFNIIQHKQICFGAKLTISKSSNMNERKLLNEIQITNFDEIITNPQNINYKWKHRIHRKYIHHRFRMDTE